MVGKALSNSAYTKKKIILLSGISINLFILFIFKYFDFFNTETRDILHWMGIEYDIPNLNLILPVAISFYTFQILSYIIDVYRGETKAEQSLGTFALYVVFFPQLVAGPIERSRHFLPQLRKLRNKESQNIFDFEYNRVVSGLRLILLGIFKKVVISDTISHYVNWVFSNNESLTGGYFLLAAYAFAFQIYFDFSAYTDIARGCSRTLGVELSKNFDMPYLSRSISEFWRKWHISLTSWFRDYVYIPLGGNKKGNSKWIRNVTLVFLLSGVWHGASWTFIIWGSLHALFYYVEKSSFFHLFSEAFYKYLPNSLLVPLQVSFVFTLTSLAWIFFRAESLSDAIYMVTLIFSSFFNSIIYRSVSLFTEVEEIFWQSSFGIFGAFRDFLEFTNGPLIPLLVLLYHLAYVFDWAEKICRQGRLLRWGIYYLAILIIVFYGSFGQQQFIYFQF